LLTRVEFIKRTAHKTFVVVDAAMNDLMRPAMYDAYHPVFPARDMTGEEMTADIVGGICESSDIFAKNRKLPAALKTNNLIVIGVAGAYGATMAGTYNARDQIAEVMVNGGRHALVRQRWSIQDQLKLENIPEWIK
jgi:diaminopimelate decarboxylase